MGWKPAACQAMKDGGEWVKILLTFSLTCDAGAFQLAELGATSGTIYGDHVYLAQVDLTSKYLAEVRSTQLRSTIAFNATEPELSGF